MKNRMQVSILTLSLLATTAWTGLAAAETLTVTDIVTTAEGGFELRVPTIEAVDANIDEAAIRAMFTENFAASATALAGLDAAAIRIPEIIVAYDVPDERGEMSRAQVVYAGFELTDVQDGVAAKAAIAGTTITGDAHDSTITIGAMSTNHLDIGAILGFYGLTLGQSEERRPIYKDFVAEGGNVTSEAVNCTIGSATAESFSARPLKGTFADLIRVTAELQQMEAAEDAAPSPEAIATIINFYADFLDALESSPTLFEGFSCDGKGPDGKSFMMAAGPGSVGGFSPGIYPGFALDNLVVEADDGSFHLGNFTWKPMDVEDVLENLVATEGNITEEWLAANWRFLVPQVAGLSLTGLAMDIPGADGGPERMQLEVAAFDVSLGDYVNGIPSTVSTSTSGLDFAVPDGEDGAALRALGIERLTLDSNLAAHWNRDDKTITIERLALSGGDLGSINVSGTLANAGPELFSERNEVMMAASMALTATDLKIEVENAGVLSLIIAAAAAEEKQPPEKFQVAMAGMAQALPLAILGGTPEALQLSAALGAFMSGTPNLTLTLTSTDPKGIGLAELMAAEDDPSVLKGKVSIAAEVSGEPVPFVWPEMPAAEPAPAPPEESGNSNRVVTKN